MRNSRKKFKIVSSKIFSTMIVIVILAIYSLIVPINKINAATYNQTIINANSNNKNGINAFPWSNAFAIFFSDSPTREFRTLRAIEDFVRILKADSEATDNNIQSELDNTQIGVGLSGDGSYNADKETYYLKDATSIMNALKVLDSLMYEAIKGITI